MHGISYQQRQCPYCGETIELQVDASAGSQTYVEDCSVCCRPIEIRANCEAGDCELELRRDDD